MNGRSRLVTLTAALTTSCAGGGDSEDARSRPGQGAEVMRLAAGPPGGDILRVKPSMRPAFRAEEGLLLNGI